MTREEAKRIIREAHFNIDNPNKEGEIAVDRIYDDFKKKMNTAKERSLKQLSDIWDLEDKLELKYCQTCKHYNDADEFFGGKCKPKNVNMDKDDGCLKGWEDGKQI